MGITLPKAWVFRSIECIFLCIQHFYHVLISMRRPQGKGLELARKHITYCLSELDSMLKLGEFLRLNNSYGTIVDGIENQTTASGCQPIGFDPTLNSRLSAPTPPRAIKLLSWRKVSFQKLAAYNRCALFHNFMVRKWETVTISMQFVHFSPCQAIEYFQKLLYDLHILCFCSLDSALEMVMHFVVEFQKLHPDLVARSYLQVGFEVFFCLYVFV